MKKKVTVVLICVCLSVFVLAGSGIQGAAADADENSLTGQVSAVDGTSVTLAIGTIPDMAEAGAPGGEPPAGGSGASDGGAPAGEPGGAGTELPAGGFGDRQGGGIMLTGEEQVITISDTASVTLQNGIETAAGTIADIEIGSILTVTLTDGVATAVVIYQGMPDGNRLTGQVTAINGSEITLSVRMGPEQGGQGAPGGEAPAGGPGGGSGEPPAGGPVEGQESGGAPEGEEQVITLADTVSITIRNGNETSEGTADDIAVGSNLTVTLSESDGTATDVVIHLSDEAGSAG